MDRNDLPLDGPAVETDDEGLEPGADPAETGILATLRRLARRYRKAIAGIVAVPVAAVFVHFGLDALLGVELSDQLEVALDAAIVGAIVGKAPKNAET